MQDVGISTQDSREYLIRRFIRPAWGSSPLHALSTEDITNWENSLPARAGISRRTARDARSLLCTILGDAAAHKPPLIPYNPALRPRNCGRRTGRRLDRGLHLDQASMIYEALTSDGRVSVGVGPAGSSKTHTVAAGARAWQANGGQVIGITTSQAARNVLAQAGISNAWNSTRFLNLMSEAGERLPERP